MTPRSSARRPARGSAAVVAVSTAAGAFLNACQPAQAPAPQVAPCPQPDVALTIVSARNVNPDDDGQPRPVQVRLYQLKSDSRLRSASFDEIWKGEKSTLRDDLVGVSEFPVYPDTRSQGTVQPAPEARFLALVALFRNPRGRTFWTEYEMPAQPKGHCSPSPLSFAVYVDQTRVTEGSDHLDDPIGASRVHDISLRFDTSSSSGDKTDDASRGPKP